MPHPRCTFGVYDNSSRTRMRVVIPTGTSGDEDEWFFAGMRMCGGVLVFEDVLAGMLLPRRICASGFRRCGSTVNLLFLVTSMVRPRDLDPNFGISHSIS